MPELNPTQAQASLHSYDFCYSLVVIVGLPLEDGAGPPLEEELPVLNNNACTINPIGQEADMGDALRESEGQRCIVRAFNRRSATDSRDYDTCWECGYKRTAIEGV